MADIEELDYHITFPAPSLAEDDPVYDDNLLEQQINSPKEPVIILLGWAGCKEKHLRKYGAIYDKRCITIEYTAPTEDIFYKQKNLSKSACKILDLLKDLSLEDNPIFFHVFSNGGGMMYQQISKHIKENSQYKNTHVMGCIFDSLPSERKLRIAAKALMATMKTNMLFGYILALFLMAFLFITDIVYKLKGSDKSKNSYWDYMANETATWPSLYLYSKADEIVNYCYIDEVINRRKAIGCDVQNVCWEDSPHVQHFRCHRDSYIIHCHQFIDYCTRKVNS